jgi:hypothetical protein
MSSLLSQERAQAITKPYHSLWREAHAKAEKQWWQTLRQSDPKGFVDLGATARATVMHDWITGHIERSGGSSVVTSTRLGFFVQLVSGSKGTALVRFKLLDRQMRTRNHISDQQDILDVHQLTPPMMGQLSLDGLEEQTTLLTCGYQLTQDETSISRVLMVCHLQRQVAYWYDVVNGAGQEVLALPRLAPPPQSHVRSRRSKEETEAE